MSKDYSALIDKIIKLKTSKAFLTTNKDGHIILGNRLQNIYYKLIIQDHIEEKKPKVAGTIDVYTIITNVFLYLDNEFRENDESLVYEIYGYRNEKGFEMEELTKIPKEFNKLECYFREEIEEDPEATMLLKEIEAIIDKINSLA